MQLVLKGNYYGIVDMNALIRFIELLSYVLFAVIAILSVLLG
jgi:hypothetical protein